MASDQAHWQSPVSIAQSREAGQLQTFHPAKDDHSLTSQHPRILANSNKVLPSTSGCCTSSLREPVGRIYQQTFIDSYSKVGFAKLYDRKTPITAADLLNDRVIPFFDEHNVALLRILTDRGTEYCGNPERHEYELYLAVEDIDHSRTKTKSPQTNGIVERFHKTILNEFYRVAFRKKVYRSIEELQADLDLWIEEYNEVRTHQGRWCYGKTPMQTFRDSIDLAREKMIAAE